MSTDRISIMPQVYQSGPFSMLPYRRPPWKEFVLTMGVQSIALFLLVWLGVLNMAVLDPPTHDYHFIRLVDTPPPVNLEPAPVKEIPAPQVARVETPAPEVLRLPPPEVQPKPRQPGPEDAPIAPNIEVAAHKPVPLPPTLAVIPRQLVKTNIFPAAARLCP